MAGKKSERIKLWGIVQGVGFRPYVAKLANKFSMKGEVLNSGGLVEIALTDTEQRIDDFLDSLLANKPAPSEIVHIKREPIEYKEYDGFSIIGSNEGEDEPAMIPADLAICPDCLKELYDTDNPRYMHPFISCMACGPRYTIIDRIPYDRGNTSMLDFPMCGFCESQYTDLHDRRYHAQTISCHSCGPRLLWAENPSAPLCTQSKKNGDISDQSLLDNTASILKSGGVIAFKSVGGYNLVADPLNADAVSSLREIKKRETKPFALMFRSLEQIHRYCHVSDTESRLLSSSARPILLLKHKGIDEIAANIPTTRGKSFDELQKSRFIGSFLPGFAAQYMLLDRISPLIFTSANLSDMPMIRGDSEMLSMMEREPLISGMLYNERDIRVRADDSVCRVIDDQPQMIRRSKGYAPVPLYIGTSASQNVGSNTMILAAGSQLKNSFALTKGSFAYMSQFFGDMDTVENQAVYNENVRRLCELFNIHPEMMVCDMHPLYYTTEFAKKYAAERDIPLITVQHHHAHIASVMAENNLQGKVIGVSFDGTGYGTDGCIWGGEILLCEKNRAKRIGHLRYVDMIGGDSSVRDAMRSAISYIHAYEASANHDTCGQADDCRSIEMDISDIIRYGREKLMTLPNATIALNALEKKINTVKSSSMGRLFDAVSALLGIKTYNDYEGQCAIMLEDAAAFARKHPGEDKACDLALSFHNRVIDMIVDECISARDKYAANQIALSGGTFQNKILLEGVLKALRDRGFKPYYNISVSPNDGGIALGQAYVAMQHASVDS